MHAKVKRIVFFILAVCFFSAGSRTLARASDVPAQDIINAIRSLYGNQQSTGTNSQSDQSGTASNQTQSSNVITTQQLMEGMESSMIGPKVEDVGLTELFHESYRIYEERLNEDVSVLTTVANGTLINRPVMIDVPQGVSTVLKRDGEEVSFESRKPIKDQGSYVLTLYVLGEDEGNKAFSEQVIQKAKFRFRIQYEIGIDGVEAGTSPGEGIAGLSGTEEASSNETERYEEMASMNAIYEDGLFPDEEISEEDEIPEELLPDDYEYQEPDRDTEAEIPDTISGTVSPESLPDGLNGSFLAVNGMSSEYDAESGFYKNTLLTNDVFYTNVPNGMITNEPVTIQASSQMTYRVYKDGEALDGYEAGQYIQEAGSYTVYVEKDDPSYSALYNGRYPVFRFRIITAPVSDLGVFNAPFGTTIESVAFNGNPDPDSLISTDTVSLGRDGGYMVALNTPNGTVNVNISVDTATPLFRVDVRPNEADIVYLSDDISYCTLYKGEELVEQRNIIDRVQGAGEYTLTAYDAAGNSSSLAFRIRYRVNAGAVVAIILVIGIIVGLLAYLIKIRKKVSVV